MAVCYTSTDIYVEVYAISESITCTRDNSTSLLGKLRYYLHHKPIRLRNRALLRRAFAKQAGGGMHILPNQPAGVLKWRRDGAGFNPTADRIPSHSSPLLSGFLQLCAHFIKHPGWDGSPGGARRAISEPRREAILVNTAPCISRTGRARGARPDTRRREEPPRSGRSVPRSGRDSSGQRSSSRTCRRESDQLGDALARFTWNNATFRQLQHERSLTYKTISP